MIWLLSIALASQTVELEWMATPIVKEKPDCSTDQECSQAFEKMKTDVKSEAQKQAKSSAVCSDMEASLGASSSEVKSVYIREMNPVPSDTEITWHITGKVTCTFYE